MSCVCACVRVSCVGVRVGATSKLISPSREEEGEPNPNLRMILYLQLTSLRRLFLAISHDLGIPVGGDGKEKKKVGEEGGERDEDDPTVSTYLAVFGLRTWQRVPQRRVEQLLVDQGREADDAAAVAGWPCLSMWRTCIVSRLRSHSSLTSPHLPQPPPPKPNAGQTPIYATNMVYVHSKLLVTESCALVTSANINDRSLRGSRDSELGVLVGGSTSFHTSLASSLIASYTGVAPGEEKRAGGAFLLGIT